MLAPQRAWKVEERKPGEGQVPQEHFLRGVGLCFPFTTFSLMNTSPLQCGV